MSASSDTHVQAAQAVDRAAQEPVSVLPWNTKVLVWPGSHFKDFFLTFGAGWFLFLIGMMLIRIGPISAWVGIAIIACIIFLGMRWAFRRLRAQMGETPYAGPLPRGESGRLRVFAPSRQLAGRVENFNDAPFEPIILRCIQSVSFGGLDENGQPKTTTSKGKGSHFQLAESTSHITAARTIADAASILLALAAILVIQRLNTGSWWKGLNTGACWSAVALAAFISAFVKPAYLRISPGALDVLIYPPLGIGPPLFERYNLRNASVTIDEKIGWIGVFDSSRKERQALFMRRHGVLTRDNVGALLINAARSSHPTPPLPTDALLG